MTPTTRIELTKPHRHAGRDYKPGAVLALPAAKADWLIGIGSAKSAPTPAPAPSPAPSPAPAKSGKD